MPEIKAISLFILAVAASVLLLRNRRQSSGDANDDTAGGDAGPDGKKYTIPTKIDTDLDEADKEISEKKKKSKENSENSMKDSVKPYDRHILVFGSGSADSWPDRIEDPSSATSPMSRRNALGLTTELIGLIKEHNMALKRAGKASVDVTVTCSSEPVSKNCQLGYYEAVMYPEAVVFQIAPSNLARFVELSCHTKRNMVDMLDKSIFKAIPTPWEYLICVCAHAQRDKRCGRAGPQVIERIQAAFSAGAAGGLAAKDIKVVNTSHIGGHAFAGTLIVYPIAHWYGQVTAKGDSVEKILAEISTGGCYENCHRGTGELVTW